MKDPKTAGHPFDHLVDMLANRIKQTINRSPTSDKPFGQVKLNQDEQLEQYISMREDPNEWYNMLNTKGLRAVGQYAQAMEPLLRRKVENGSSTDQAGQAGGVDGGGANGSNPDTVHPKIS